MPLVSDLFGASSSCGWQGQLMKTFAWFQVQYRRKDRCLKSICYQLKDSWPLHSLGEKSKGGGKADSEGKSLLKTKERDLGHQMSMCWTENCVAPQVTAVVWPCYMVSASLPLLWWAWLVQAQGRCLCPSGFPWWAGTWFAQTWSVFLCSVPYGRWALISAGIGELCTRGRDKKQNLFIKKVYSYMIKLQSPSKYSTHDAIHLLRLFFPLLKTVFELVNFDDF